MSKLRFGLGLAPVNQKGFFSFSKIPNLVLDMDFADAQTITASGNNVTGVADKSGRSNDALALGVSPLTNTRTLGGKNALELTATDNQGLYIPYNDDFAISKGATVFVVGESDNISLTYRMLLGQAHTSGTRVITLYNKSAAEGIASTYYPDNINGAIINRPVPIANAVPFIAAMRYDPAADTHGVYNGRTVPRSRNNSITINEPASPANIAIGNIVTGALPWDGAIGRALWYARALKDAEIDKIGQHLAKLYNLAWIKSGLTLLALSGGQSNSSNGFESVDRGYEVYSSEGLAAFESTLASYYADVEYLQQTDTGEPVMKVNKGAGSDNWWIDTDLSDGPILIEWDNQTDSYVGGVGAWGCSDKSHCTIWIGGEGDGGTDEGDFETALEQLFNRFIALTNTGHKIFCVIPGTGSNASYQRQRNAILDLIESMDNVYFAAEACDLDMADADHYSAAAQTILHTRIANRVAAVLGKRSEVGTLGPIITSATYSGSSVVATFEKDGDFDLSGSETGQFHIEDDGVPLTINSFTIDNDANTIIFTLDSTIAAGSIVKLWCNYDQITGLTKAAMVKDSNGLPMRSVKELEARES